MTTQVPVSEAEYEERALPELNLLVDALDKLELDDLEAELAGDILSLEFGDGATYVINSHRAARQIWMAAERNAWHFDYDSAQDRWVEAKTGEELWAALNRVLSQKAEGPVLLTRTTTTPE